MEPESSLPYSQAPAICPCPEPVDSYEQIFIVAPQLTIEIVLGTNFLSNYEVILDFGGTYLTMKRDEVIRHHEFFYNTVPKAGKEIDLTAKPDQLIQQVHIMSMRNCQISKSNFCIQSAEQLSLIQQTNK